MDSKGKSLLTFINFNYALQIFFWLFKCIRQFKGGNLLRDRYYKNEGNIKHYLKLRLLSYLVCLYSKMLNFLKMFDLTPEMSLNLCFLFARYFTWCCRVSKKIPLLKSFLLVLKSQFHIESYKSRANQKKWEPLFPFLNIN